ncbi:MAG TPA: M48 family peptidase [Gammaproteobacteria bacterium]|jgi:predicted metal-dependent hydrolase|nr:M48 family peptidase [Gammaproteobacteria bacterium]HIN90411.1 M48 family peptidase [Porticoccaceae bacterium]HIO76644.1 M48 family peptidase [Gammaproteobacteria bacterium]
MTEPKIVSLNFGHVGGSRAQPFSYEVQRSKRKTLAIYISHRKVVVRCPLRASALELRQFVSANQQWIEKRLLEESLRDKELLRIERGGKIFCRARELEIVFKQGRKQRILISLDQFIIQGHKLNATKARIQVEDYLIDKASEYLLPRARGLARHLGVDHKIKEIKLRKTKSKWGHCTSAGIIQYNWLIMLAPYSIIDYMITHEVCHLVHMDHSKRFWSLVESICPQYDKYVDWLKQHEHRFWF